MYIVSPMETEERVRVVMDAETRRELRENLWAIEEAVSLMAQGHVVTRHAATLVILRRLKELRSKLL